MGDAGRWLRSAGYGILGIGSRASRRLQHSCLHWLSCHQCSTTTKRTERHETRRFFVYFVCVVVFPFESELGKHAMFGQPRIGTKDLAGLCRRLAISVHAGIDDRRIWQREADRARPSQRKPLRVICDSVGAGQSVGEALGRTGRFFPPLFHAMVDIAEKTGRMADVLGRMADHYEHQRKMHRLFLSGIFWPLLQLFAAFLVIGILIWVMGVLGVDLLRFKVFGFPLMGTSGLVVYLVLVGLAVLAVGLAIRAFVRGALWIRPLQRIVLAIPMLGSGLQTIALAQLTWSLHMLLDVQMDLRRVLPLALRSTGNHYYIRHVDQVVADVATGCEIYDVLRRTDAFPVEFLDAVEVAEQSGSLVESLGRLSQQYADQARHAVNTLTVIAGFAVWGMVALVIIVLIFRLASAYVGMIMDATKF